MSPQEQTQLVPAVDASLAGTEPRNALQWWPSGADKIVDVWFMFDFVLNFFIGNAVRDGAFVLGWKRIRKRYLRLWFTLDFISSVPLEEITSVIGTALSLSSLVKLLQGSKHLKPLGLSKLGKVVKLVETSETVPVFNKLITDGHWQTKSWLFGILLGALVLAHWHCCFLLISGDGGLASSLDTDTMIMSRAYLASYYWAFRTITRTFCGYIRPSSDGERLYAMVAAVIGGSSFCYIIATVISSITCKDLKKCVSRDRLDHINQWLDHRFTRQVCQQITGYFGLDLKENKGSAPDEPAIIKAMFPDRCEEVVLYLVSDGVFASHVHSKLPIGLTSRFFCILQQVIVKQGEHVVRCGEVGTDLYALAICMRQCSSSSNSSTILHRVFHRADCFGEEILFDFTVSCFCEVFASVRSKLYSARDHDFKLTFEIMRDVVDEMRLNYIVRIPPDYSPYLSGRECMLHRNGHLRVCPLGCADSVLALLESIPQNLSDEMCREFMMAVAHKKACTRCLQLPEGASRRALVHMISVSRPSNDGRLLLQDLTTDSAAERRTARDPLDSAPKSATQGRTIPRGRRSPSNLAFAAFAAAFAIAGSNLRVACASQMPWWQESSLENAKSLALYFGREAQRYFAYTESSIASSEKGLRMYFNIARGPTVKNVCEIGFNAGHSAAVFLNANPQAHVYSFDIAHFQHTLGNLKLMKDLFPDRFEYILGSSETSVRDFHKMRPDVKCDIISVDGDHSTEGTYHDLLSMRELASCRNWVLMDDAGLTSTNDAWQRAKDDGILTQIECFIDVAPQSDFQFMSVPTNRAWCLGFFNVDDETCPDWFDENRHTPQTHLKPVID